MLAREAEISSHSSDVIVVGAGVVGSSIAWRAARAGVQVVLVDPDVDATDFGASDRRAASWAAAGMLTPVTEAHYGEEELLALNLASSRLYPGFVAELESDAGLDVGYRRCGTVVVGRDSDDMAALDDLLAFQRRLGLDVTKLSATEIREIAPRLSPRVRGGLLVEGDHQVDNRALLSALHVAIERSGGRLHRGRVVRVDVDGGRVRGVELEDGTRLPADAIVIAAGVWSGELEGVPPGTLPKLRPVKGQLLHLRGPAFLDRNVRGLDVYIVPRADGRVIVGATMEERGFDLTPTAEAAYELLRDAYELVPGILELELVEHSVGLRPTTADNAPVIGPTEVPGLFLATGHFRNGVLLAPVTANAIVELLDERDPTVDLGPFAPDRFRSTRVAS